MSRFLLDTNIISDLVRHPAGAVTAAIRAAGEDAICTSIIVAAELRYGARKKGSEQLVRRVEALLSRIPVLPLEAPADEVYGQIRTSLERSGSPIGANDMLIAAHALALDATLVTDNEREFRRIDGLKMDNWLRVSDE